MRCCSNVLSKRKRESMPPSAQLLLHRSAYLNILDSFGAHVPTGMEHEAT